MDIIVQGKKRKKVFLIEDDGNIQYAPEFTVEEQQSFAISKLELWKEADINDNYNANKIMDTNHAKLLLYQDKSLDVENKDSKGNTKLTMKKAAMKRAIESANKAAAELSILTQVAALIQSNKILNLQTFNNDTTQTVSKNNDNEHLSDALSNIQTKPLRELPLVQRIHIQINSIKTTKSIILKGINKCKKLIQIRQNYSNIMKLCHENKSLNVCYIEKKTNKRIYHRNYDSKKDYIAIDCSIHIINTINPNDDDPLLLKTHMKTEINTNIPLGFNKTNLMKKTQYIANDLNATGLMMNQLKLTNYVPIIQNTTTGEVEIQKDSSSTTPPISSSTTTINNTSSTSSSQDGYTLQLQLQMRDSSSNSNTTNTSTSSSATSTIYTLCTTTVWELLGYYNNTQHTTTSSNSSSNTNNTVTKIDAIHTLTQHCKRQKHETLCHNLFNKLRIECIDNAKQWNILQSTTNSNSLTSNKSISTQNRNFYIKKVVNKILYEKLSSNIVVVDIRDDKIVLQLSELLLLTISLVSISSIDIGTNDSSNSSISNHTTTTTGTTSCTATTAMEVEVDNNSTNTTSVENRGSAEGCSIRIQTQLQCSIEKLLLHTILSILPTTSSTTGTTTTTGANNTQQIQATIPRVNSYWNTIKQYEQQNNNHRKERISLIQKFLEELKNMRRFQHK